MSFPILDFHVHSTLKPYGHSAYTNENPKDASSEASIWYSDPPSLGDKVIENIAGFPRFRQSDFTSLVKGGANIAVVSMYPIETSFVKPSVSPLFSNFLVNLISLFGRYRIENIKKPDFSYFKDLQQEYAFLKSLNNTVPANGTRKYKLVGSGNELSAALPSDALLIITSIEGAHVFCDGHDVEVQANWANLAANVALVKSWEFPPFFITLNHHFYNALASHAMSLFDIVAKLLDQSYKMDVAVTPDGKYITPLGYQMIDLLYATNNGQRILIDIKHMAKRTRQEFYAYRKAKYNDVPIICSHTGVTKYYSEPINMDEEDIKEIYDSKGMIGIELDQRILGYNKAGNRFSSWFRNIFRSSKKTDYVWAEYFWKNILYIAEQCYRFDSTKNPWQIICLGSDLDGVINPLNKFRTAADFHNLAEALLQYVQEYWDSPNSTIPKNHLKCDAHDVVYQIMYSNALEFIMRNYSKPGGGEVVA
jgi:microsomal dipeptidase-like Zn-dependent dipeptidase